MLKGEKKIITVFLTIYALFSALLFLFPTVLTIANSFMSSTEITSNYGMIFQNASSDSSDSQNGSNGKKNL